MINLNNVKSIVHNNKQVKSISHNGNIIWTSTVTKTFYLLVTQYQDPVTNKWFSWKYFLDNTQPLLLDTPNDSCYFTLLTRSDVEAWRDNTWSDGYHFGDSSSIRDGRRVQNDNIYLAFYDQLSERLCLLLCPFTVGAQVTAIDIPSSWTWYTNYNLYPVLSEYLGYPSGQSFQSKNGYLSDENYSKYLYIDAVNNTATSQKKTSITYFKACQNVTTLTHTKTI